MELTQLKYFFITAGYEHITRAAEELHIAQPALTQSIHRLEEELGIKLFERHGRNIKLSPSGRILQKRLSVIFSELDSAIAEMWDVAGIRHKTLRLNVMAASKVVTDIIIA
jgi:DNA-binding transcriptional LysR family regulator